MLMTPGPWTIGKPEDNSQGCWSVASEGETNGFHVIAVLYGPDAPANASAIAALPEALAILKEALAVHGTEPQFLPDPEEHSWCAKARAAIDKAEGA